ncbi:MAG: hypothetical protein AB1724_12970 [Thermodesulfobacteriota bacterium]
MSHWPIQINPDLCAGCLRCLLACSRLYDGRFSLAAAGLKVTLSGTGCTVVFLNTCVQCGVCADNCFYGALVRQGRKEGPP